MISQDEEPEFKFKEGVIGLPKEDTEEEAQAKKRLDYVNIKGRSYYMDGYLRSNLDIGNKLVKSDLDLIGIIDGYPGYGKSTLSQQMALYLDPDFNIDRIGLTTEDFERAVMNCPKYGCVIYDEAITGLMGDEWFKESNRTLKKMLNQIRQKNLKILMNIPTAFDLSKSIVLHRSHFLIHVYAKPGIEGPKRGFFFFYDAEQKRRLYVYGQKFYDYHAAHPTFWGHFPKGYTVDEAEYRKRKSEAFEKGTGGELSYKTMDTRNALAYLLHKELKNSTQAISDRLGMIDIYVGRRVLDQWVHDADELFKRKIAFGLLRRGFVDTPTIDKSMEKLEKTELREKFDDKL